MLYKMWYVDRLEEKEKVSILLEDEKKRATEQAKLLEMDLEVSLACRCLLHVYYCQHFRMFCGKKKKTLQQVEVILT